MKNYDRLMLNEVANSYRKMILNEAQAQWPPPNGSGLPNWWEDPDNTDAVRNDPRNPRNKPKPKPQSPRGPRKPHVFTPADQMRPPVPGWRPVPAPEQTPGDHSGFAKDRRFVTPDNPKGYWRWDGGRSTDPTATTRPTRTPAPKPGPRPIRGIRPAVGAAGAVALGLSLWSIYQQLFGDDGVEVDVIPDDGVDKPINVDQPGLDLQPMQVPEHLRNPHSYPGQHPVRPPKAPAGGSQGSGGGIGGGGGMGM